jgi:Ca2+-transporting ATPase
LEQQKFLKYYTLDAEEVLSSLQTDPAGLSEEEVKRRLERFGPNELREEKRVTPLSIFLDQFKGILVIILMISALISGFILREFVDTAVILAIVLMNATLGFYQEYRAEKAVEALKRMVAPMARVLREGRGRIVPSKELVPGDIILLEAGDKVPADARLLEALTLKVDEAPLTGESTPVTKDTGDLAALAEEIPLADRRNMIFMGTHVAFGRGKAAVTETGMRTEFGKIAGMVQEVEAEESPLKKRVERLGRQLGLISLLLSLWIFIVGILVHKTSVTEMFLTTISLAVSAIPEGLPAVITVTLTLGVGRMARQRAIVRKLASVETLGCTTVICSDKTGTLTKNEMTVSKLYANGEVIEVSGSGYEPKGEFLRNGSPFDPKDDKAVELLLEIGALCNNASLKKEGERWTMMGDPTEGALVTAAVKAGLWQEKLAEEHPRASEVPFDSTRKRMSTIHVSSKGRVLYIKGAPESILDLSSHIYEEGKARELGEEDRRRILEVSHGMAEEALRLLAMAYRELPEGLEEFTEEDEGDLTLVGLVGMIDPPREEVPEAIRLCRRAGIRSIMITGDHKQTAVAIAKKIGMIPSQGDALALTGEELDLISDEALLEVVDKVYVYARTSPEHKMRIARALKQKGHIVAMTGDGVNDAPAIKMADIGVAMGIKGTDVTKEASDMVLEDDNFATIVSAVEEGRHIYENIKKYIRLMITANFDEFFEVTIASLAGLPLPFLPLQILWVNLVSDGLPAVALSIDPKEPDLMDKPPRDPNEGILGRIWRFVFVGASLDFLSSFLPFLWALTAGFTYWGPWGLDDPLTVKARTMGFSAVVFFEFFLAYNSRSETQSILKMGWKGTTANRMLFYSIMASMLIQVAIIYMPFLHPIFHTTALSPLEFAVCTIGALSGLLLFPGKLIKKQKYQSETLGQGSNR